jgi:2-keto-4-pentenoate hydratase/2-oxohepta-3-ene-1,7-dioic acid hydratase in catechol pathway
VSRLGIAALPRLKIRLWIRGDHAPIAEPRCSLVAPPDAWSVVPGLMLGQDISDRSVQLSGAPPHFSLVKSFSCFGPTAAVVSMDAFDDPDDIGLRCDVAGERMKESRSRQPIFPVAPLIAYLSSICTLYPGDLIFTGTPSGVGMTRRRFLAPGEVIVSGAEVIGELRGPCVGGKGAFEP